MGSKEYGMSESCHSRYIQYISRLHTCAQIGQCAILCSPVLVPVKVT
jgi:hypothetical protein